jgi:hypothetical protein
VFYPEGRLRPLKLMESIVFYQEGRLRPLGKTQYSAYVLMA